MDFITLGGDFGGGVVVFQEGGLPPGVRPNSASVRKQPIRDKLWSFQPPSHHGLDLCDESVLQILE